jgi:N-methylhydantoinase A
VRPSLYDTQFEKPKPLVPRDRAVGVVERLGPKGEVLVPLDESSARDAAALLKREGVESVAVCLLHSYVNGDHEQRIGAILADELPGVPISLSSEVAPEFREYLRASTTVINAVIRPVVERYLERIERRLADAGIQAKLLVMQSSGGVFGSDAAAHRPVFMVESGPAAGVIAAAHLGSTIERGDILSFDMGGTTAKVGLIRDGQPSVTKDYQVGVHASAGLGGMSLAGYPVRTPVVDLVEIGAGGGSIAWVDSGGLLRVGPQSAGADPGPVCYRGGGTEPTVTDANVVLGRLNPEYFLGGEISLDVEGASRAIEERCAQPLGLSVVEAANGIVEIANAAMVNALHLISVQRGYDPRDFLLVAFGGAGPVHANALARDAEMPTVLVPPSPGIFSATGLLTTDLKRDAAQTVMQRLDALDGAEVEDVFARLERDGAAEMRAEGVGESAVEFVRRLDLRYVGQSYELTIPAGSDLASRFHEEHDRVYGFSAESEPIECVSLRVTTVGRIEKPPPRTVDGADIAQAKGSREVFFAGGYVDCPIYDRYGLGAGVSFSGPAVVEEFDSTTVVHPGYRLRVDGHGNLWIERER